MATPTDWHSDETEKREQEQPLPPLTKCTATRNFAPREPYDLPFMKGEELTIIEPCSVIFWYLAENEEGKRGVIPINYVLVHNNCTLERPALPPKPPKAASSAQPLHQLRNAGTTQMSHTSSSLPRPQPPIRDPVTRSTSSGPSPTSYSPSLRAPIDIDSRPPAPLPQEAFCSKRKTTIVRKPGKYRTFAEFSEKSGWFSPTVDNCLTTKLNMQLSAFTSLKHGTYIFVNKTHVTLKYVGRSNNLYQDLVSLIHRLFEKPEHKMSPLEVQLKYHHSDAKDWFLGVNPVVNSDREYLEETIQMVKHRTLQPEGLNSQLKFHSKEHFYAFADWYSLFRRSGGNKDH